MKSLLFRDDESLIGSNWYYLEKKLFIFPLLLSFIGLLAIYSLIGTEYSITLLFKHTVFLLFSLFILFFFSLLPVNNLRKLLNISAFSFLFLLILVPILGYEIKGATRWINLKFFSIQPSEILKGPILCLFSWFCYLFIKTGKFSYMFFVVFWFFLCVRPRLKEFDIFERKFGFYVSNCICWQLDMSIGPKFGNRFF